MTTPIRTNPAYAYLAYRKAILKHTINYLLSDVVGANGYAPKTTLVCDDVFREDSDVPPEEVLTFVEQLQQEEADLQLEMNKFDFRKPDAQPQSPKVKKKAARRPPTKEEREAN
jgi:hypothetical protein